MADPNLPNPMSDSELYKSAASQVDLEINQSTAPIQSQITTTQANKDKALGQIGGMFDALQPVVQQGANAVQSSYDQAMTQEHSVFSEAQAQLQKLRGDRANDAQAMAQAIGGPVAIDQWTQPFDNAATDLTYLGSGQQLHTLAYAQAGEQAAEQFAGQIFPLVRTEQMAAVRNQYETQVREYEDQITALKAQKGAQVNKRYQELRTQELDYGLKRAQYQLQKLDDQRNYNLEVKKAKATKVEADRTYKLDKQQLSHAIHKDANDYQLKQREAGQTDRQLDQNDKEYQLRLRQTVDAEGEKTGFINGVKTLDRLRRDDQVHQAGVQAGLDKRQIDAQIAQAAANQRAAKAKLNADQSTEWVALLENAVNPQPGKTYSETVKTEISGNAFFNDTSGDAYIEYDKKGKAHYYKNTTETKTVANNFQPINDPNRLVDYLVTAMNDKSFSKERAIKLIKDKFPELENWNYGEKFPPKGKQLNTATEEPFDLGKIIAAGNKKTKQRYGTQLKAGRRAGKEMNPLPTTTSATTTSTLPGNP